MNETHRTMLAQIGRITVGAISGGRVRCPDENTIELPVSSGMVVRVKLEADDTYTVSRVFKRAGREFDHGSMTNVYCDEVSEIAWQAHAYKSYPFGSKAGQPEAVAEPLALFASVPA